MKQDSTRNHIITFSVLAFTIGQFIFLTTLLSKTTTFFFFYTSSAFHSGRVSETIGRNSVLYTPLILVLRRTHHDVIVCFRVTKLFRLRRSVQQTKKKAKRKVFFFLLNCICYYIRPTGIIYFEFFYFSPKRILRYA